MRNKIIVSVLGLFIVVDAVLIYLALTISPIKLKRNTFVFQYGEEIPVNVEEYVTANPSVLASVKLDLSGVLKDVGTYQASIEYFGKKQTFEIQVIDTIKPKVQLKKVQFNIEVGKTIYAKDLIEKIEDQSQTTVYFYNEITKEKTKSKSYLEAGSHVEKIIVEDEHGNQSSTLRVKIVVEKNKVLPRIIGADPMEVHVGDLIDLRKGVKAIDDVEGDITFRMIISGTVDNQVSGEYQVIYTVTDNAGNIGKVIRKVTVIEDDN